MLTLPAHIMDRLDPFAPVFSRRVWRYVPTLVGGAILAPGRRMVSSTLRVMGLGHCRAFSTYHRVLNRDVWSSLSASRILLGLLVAAFAPTGPLVVGIDATLERRRGPKISAAGIYRDPVRSSHSHFVKVRALRWVSLMLLVPIPWAHWTWALPFLTALAPSERYDDKRGQRHKAVPRWAQQMILQLHRWYPARALVIVGDQEYAAIDLRAATRQVATIVTRLRLDARLCEPAPPRPPDQTGRPRVVGPRLPTLTTRAADPTTAWTALTVARWYGEDQRDIEIVSGTAVWYHGGKPPVPIRWVLIRDPRGAFPTQALLCTDLAATPEQIVAWFVLRWRLEVTCHEVRDHLGVETQRQWSELAIRRVTPALLGLFSFVTLLAHDQITAGACPVRQAAWYPKHDPTFVDALALVRRSLWAGTTFACRPQRRTSLKSPVPWLITCVSCSAMPRDLVTIGRALQPFPRPKRSVRLSPHSAFQSGSLVLVCQRTLPLRVHAPSSRAASRCVYGWRVLQMLAPAHRSPAPGGPSPCPSHYRTALGYYAASALSFARWHSRVPSRGEAV